MRYSICLDLLYYEMSLSGEIEGVTATVAIEPASRRTGLLMDRCVLWCT